MMTVDNEQRRNERIKYFNELKENANFLVGLSGGIIALTIFHYSVYLIRKSEYYNVNTDLLNETIITDGIRTFLDMILVLISLISLFFFLSYYPRKILSKRNIELEDNRMGSTVIGLVAALLLSICLFIIYDLSKGYTQELPNTKSSFIVLTLVIAIHIIAVTINYKLSFKNTGTKTIVDVPVTMQMLYIVAMFAFYLFPYYAVDNLIKTEGNILVTNDNKYMIVEKNPSDVLLRAMKQSDENVYTYYLTDDYIQKDAKKVVFKSRKIDTSVDYEKEGFLRFKVDGEN